MAKKIITTIDHTDDFDGSAAAGAVRFSHQGTDYEIDLSKKNRAAFERALRPYIEVARKVRRSSRRATSTGTKRSDLADIRAWAKSAGKDVSDRGRIPADIVAEYDGLH